jgi:uncharacterized damage-inducible protein DinB
MKKHLSLVVAAVLVCSVAMFTAFDSPKPEKAESTEFVNSVMQMWGTSRMHTLEVLDAMPEDKFSYKPTDVSKTFGSQMVHIGYTLKYFSQAMIKGEKVEYAEPDPSTMSKADIRKLVEEGFDMYTASIKELKPEDLSVEMPLGPEYKITRQQSIIFAHDHVTNHRAKANLYIRMNDIDPPTYKF